MKKILTFLMLFAASNLLLITITDVHANEPSAISEYHDLFYEDVEVEFEILTIDDPDGYFIPGTLTPGTYDLIDEYYMYYNEYTMFYRNGVIIDQSITLQYNDDFGGVFHYGINPYNSMSGALRISEVDGEFLLTGGGQDLQVGDVFKIVFKVKKTWSQAYDYGRVRHSVDSTVRLILDDDVVKPVNNTTNDFFNVNLLEQNDEIVIQSPYENFKIYQRNAGTGVENILEEYENVAAVVFKFYRVESTPYMDFEIFYWDLNNALQKTELLEYYFPSDYRFAFYGGVRKAISGEAAIISNVDDNNDIDYYLQFLTAWDDIDGDISDSIYVIEYGDYSGAVVGSYEVVVGVKDSENQESIFEFTAVVADMVSPILVAPNLEQTINAEQTFNFTTYLASLVKSDNYYEDDDITITIQSNEYTENKSIPGTYNVVLRVKDPSLNYTDYTLEITVIDETPPQFTQGLTTLSKSINEEINTAQIIATQRAVDAVDGDVSDSITIVSNTYKGNETTPGNYTIVIKAVDAAGNEATKTIMIEVFSAPPGWYIADDGPIIIPAGSTLTFEQIRAVLILMGWVEEDDDLELVSTNYFGNEGAPGTYTLTLSLNGNNVTYNLLVLNQDDDIFPDIPDVPGQSKFNPIWILGILGVLTASGLIYYFYKKK